jgi:hypothetical protein
MPSLNLNNLIGNKLDNETITKNAISSSTINKNENNIIGLKKVEKNNNKNIIEINKENDININGESKDLNDKNKIEEKDKDKKEIIDNTTKKTLKRNNTNSFIDKGEKKSSDYQIDKKGREIITINTSQNTKNENINDMNNNIVSSQNKIIFEKEKNIKFSKRGSYNVTKLLQIHNSSFSSLMINPVKNPKKSLEEMRNDNSDYYSLFQEEYIQNKLREEKDNCTEFDIYSDQIFLFTDKKHFNKKYIMITPNNLYIIEPKEMRFVKIIKTEKFLSFQISNKSTNILLFEIRNDDNILIQSLRRMDLLSYLRKHFRSGKNFVKFRYDDNFIVNIKGRPNTIYVKDKVFANLSNFDGALKIGYLLKYKGKFIGSIFKEKLFALTSIGLLMFDEPTSSPKKLYPIIGSNIEVCEGNRYGRENCFKITLFSGKTKIFAARKKREKDSWINEFNKIKEEYKEKMKELDTSNKNYNDNVEKNLLPPEKEQKI